MNQLGGPVPLRKIPATSGTPTVLSKLRRLVTGVNPRTQREINNNNLKYLPEALSSLHRLRELTFVNNRISYVPDKAFKNNRQLTLLEMGRNPIEDVGRFAFSNLPNLKELVLREVHHLAEFPDLNGTTALEHILLNRGLLQKVPSWFCSQTPHLKSLNLKSNRLSKLPELGNCAELRLIDLSYNHISSLEETPFRNQIKLIDLFLGNNLIECIPEDSFVGLQSLQVMDLKNNRITYIHVNAFAHVSKLRDLNLGNNQFSTLPTDGLQNLQQLKTFNNPNLKDFPPPESFPRAHKLVLSYAYHCCAFLPKAHKPSTLQETIVWLSKDDVDMSIWNNNMTDVWPGYGNFSSTFTEFMDQLWKSRGRDYSAPENSAQYTEDYFEDYKSAYNSEESLLSQYPVQCIPRPDPFMPCEDLFGWWTLRCGVWIVFLLAMLGNGVVVFVLLFGRSKMDVPRFLVCNLAVADFFMGIYLGLLAVVDASTLGEFRVFAIAWQTSTGCQVAGFLGVLSSELSVYTLSVITLERNYAITHAMHLNKRLSLRHAGYIMICGWVFALIMASMPLFGVSDYRKFAICLPFETDPAVSLGYVVFLILVNGVAFLILMGCYLKMYCAIRGSHAWNSNDSRIAKRMALLVFTDFVCWAPIAFFSLSAVSGLNLISLEEAKVFTIFVLPFNSCANPFLYAIFTKQFKKDCVLICKRIEESRVTRGIGRCRHSSNFSNRHTPANTNSAVERKSGGNDLPPCHCGVHMVTDGGRRRRWKRVVMRYLMCQNQTGESESNDYTYAIAQIQKNMGRGTKRATSISSENFSSRSDSWRQGNIPPRGGRPNLKRKFSQDSNMSSSRQDSSTSTIRISRSSVSSDSSNHRPGLLNFRERRGLTDSGQLVRPLGSVREKIPTSYEPSSCIARDKPRLCRQAAVDDTCHQQQIVRKSDIRHAQNSQQDMLCHSSLRKDRSSPLSFKSKELEVKFKCFYNRLAETSHEDSSDISTYKDDHILARSDQSAGDQKIDSSNTNDTSFSDPSTQEGQKKDAFFHPRIAIKEDPGHDSCQDNERDVYKWLQQNAKENLQETEEMFLGNVVNIYDSSLLNVSADNVSNNESNITSSVGLVSRLTPSRKVASDNSLKKLSLKSLPVPLGSFSSQSSRKNLKLKSGSQCQLKTSPTRTLRCSKSETIIHQHCLDDFSEWRLLNPRMEARGYDPESSMDEDTYYLSFRTPNTVTGSGVEAQQWEKN
ncbi:follicle-stimulating hormone receptor-like [Limulus polyphemus]|uniref:Follicle-stimulating hormone receptor-like n=1 Tax=Limulus polyphemus TaxID=6850 RepID=A0ABM1BUM3_LIMPO|nr:follicle-stimulating hormone receptor-like [Limulus polyphemus]